MATCRERADRRDQPAYNSELQRGPEGTHAAVEAPDCIVVIPHRILGDCPISDNRRDCTRERRTQDWRSMPG